MFAKFLSAPVHKKIGPTCFPVRNANNPIVAFSPEPCCSVWFCFAPFNPCLNSARHSAGALCPSRRSSKRSPAALAPPLPSAQPGAHHTCYVLPIMTRETRTLPPQQASPFFFASAGGCLAFIICGAAFWRMRCAPSCLHQRAPCGRF
jgi:hypothetical protein